MLSRPRRLLMPVLTAATIFAATTGDAHALVLRPAAACSDAGSAPVFRQFLDPMDYQLVSGGTFQAPLAGWTLGSASVVPGGEPWNVSGGSNTSSLLIPSGTTVESAPVCAGLARPDIRFFVRPPAAVQSALVVTASAETSSGATITVPVGTVTAASQSWQPTIPMPVLLSTLSAASSTGYSTIRLGFTVLGPGSWSIDDVYMDPFGRV
jgi:hypothetical protein